MRWALLVAVLLVGLTVAAALWTPMTAVFVFRESILGFLFLAIDIHPQEVCRA